MRISDWSSDVCSSDLGPRRRGGSRRGQRHAAHTRWVVDDLSSRGSRAASASPRPRGVAFSSFLATSRSCESCQVNQGPGTRTGTADACVRSEEHTSELQSLMRISYAVFCLKKKIYK